MSIITFWNNSRKQIGQTVAISTIATYLASEKNYKVLLMSTDCNDYSLEDAFGVVQINNKLAKKFGKENQIDLANGIEGLIRLSKTNRLTPESVKNYTKIIFTDRLEVLYTPKNIQPEEVDDLFNVYKNIIACANKYYDFVFVDLSKGVRNKQTIDILKMSNVVALNIDQGERNLEKLLEKIEKTKLISTDRLLIIIDRYDENSKYNVKSISKIARKDIQVYAVPYDTMLFEAFVENKLPELMLKLRNVNNKEKLAILAGEIQNASEGIIYKMDELRMKGM